MTLSAERRNTNTERVYSPDVVLSDIRYISAVHVTFCCSNCSAVLSTNFNHLRFCWLRCPGLYGFGDGGHACSHLSVDFCVLDLWPYRPSTEAQRYRVSDVGERRPITDVGPDLLNFLTCVVWWLPCLGVWEVFHSQYCRFQPSHLRTSSRELVATTGAVARTTWMKNIHGDLFSLDLGIYEARDLAQNRPLWRLMSLHSATHS